VAFLLLFGVGWLLDRISPTTSAPLRLMPPLATAAQLAQAGGSK